LFLIVPFLLFSTEQLSCSEIITLHHIHRRA
jgi:hypothetical protein